MSDSTRAQALRMVWASMVALQLTTDPYLSVIILQDAIEVYGNDMIQTITAELILANKKSSNDILVVKGHLTFGLFSKMDAWTREIN